MNAVTLHKIINEYFEIVPQRSTREELYFICTQPGCTDTSGHRSVNLSTQLTNCWICGRGGHIFTWLRDQGIEIDDEVAEPVSRFGLPESSYLPDDLTSVRRPRVREFNEIQLPRGFTPLSQDRSTIPGREHTVYYNVIAAMAQRKNLTIEDFVDAGAGYTPYDPKWEPYCIFPLLKFRRLKYFQGRLYIDNPDQPSKRFPSRNEFEFGASHHLYDFDVVSATKPTLVIVVESILNVLSLKKRFRELGWNHLVAVSTFHSGISWIQWNALMNWSQDGVKEICVLFDADATDKAWNEVERISRERRVSAKLSVAEMPPVTGPKCDPNDAIDAAIEALSKRQAHVNGSSRELLRKCRSLLSI